MLLIEMVSGRHVPRLYCDHCHQRIDKAGAAAVMHAQLLPDGATTPAYVVHKNFVGFGCMGALEQALVAQGLAHGWEELSTMLAYLVDNVGLTVADIEQRLDCAQP